MTAFNYAINYSAPLDIHDLRAIHKTAIRRCLLKCLIASQRVCKISLIIYLEQ